MAKVLLIYPIQDIKKLYGAYSVFAPLLIPMGLAYLASVLEKEGHTVEILDNQIEEITPAKLDKALNNNPLIAGISVTSPTLESAGRVAALIKETRPSIKVVFGGIHPTLMPDETLRFPFVDIAVRGEGEITLVELLKALEKGEGLRGIAGISYKENGSVIHNPERPYITRLDDLPFPARHLFRVDRYRPPLDMVNRYPVRVMITSRGCPYRCIFCAAKAVPGNHYRATTPDKIIEEAELLISKYNARSIIFWDDNFTFDKERVIKFSELCIKEKIQKRITWSCESRADGVDPYLLKKMAQAGCWLVQYGLETGTQRLLDLINKGTTLEQSRKAVLWTEKAGMRCRATFMLGLPTETREESLKTISFARSLKLHRAKFTLLTPYPGSELFRQMRAALPQEWVRYDAMAGFTPFEPVYVPEGRNGKELRLLQKKAMVSFYCSPRQLIGLCLLFLKLFIYRISIVVRNRRQPPQLINAKI